MLLAYLFINLFVSGTDSIPISQLCSNGYNQKLELPFGYQSVGTDSKVLISLIESQLNFTSELIKKLPVGAKIKNLPNYPENCRWTKFNGKVLLEVLEGRAFQPDFMFLLSIQCTAFADCQKLCDFLHCNYIVRSKFDGLSHMYGVIDERLNSRRMGNTIGYDSYKRDCSTDKESSGVKSNKTEETCRWKKFNGKILKEISEGRALEPDFVYHRSVQCQNFSDCQKICARSSCNYIVRSKFDGLSHMYNVVEERLQSKRLDSSVGYDSFRRECFRGSEPSLPQIDVMLDADNDTCKWEKLSGKILNEVNEGRAFEPDFIYHRSMQCSEFEECKKMCDKTSCNYIVRSKIDGLTHMYEVSEEAMDNNTFDNSKGYDSYTKKCNRTIHHMRNETNTTKPFVASNPNCKWNEIKGTVLLEIGEGRALLPDFTYHKSTYCKDLKECQTLCDELSCNYIVRSKFDGLSYLYSVVQSKLHSEYVANSTGYDSYTKQCPSGYDVLPEQNCTDCKEHRQGVNDYNPYNLYEPVHNESDFLKNMKFIEDLNGERNDDEDAFFGPNKFSDFSHDDFVDMFTGLLLPEGELETNETEFPAEIPGSKRCNKFSWLDLNVISPVRDQGSCGSCYAFTSADLAAAQYRIERSMWNETFELSPQFIIDCLRPPAAFGCNGGRPVNVFKSLANSSVIIPKESCYPYASKVGECKVPECEKDPEEEEVTVKWANLINLSGKSETTKFAELLHWGPLIAFIDASPAWQFYNGTGIIKSRHCRQVSNHAVLIVGYDYLGKTPYYQVKNSWGAEYGDHGYVKLEAGKNACNVAANIVVACTSNCEHLENLKKLTKRPHSTSCVEFSGNIAANISSALFE